MNGLRGTSLVEALAALALVGIGTILAGGGLSAVRRAEVAAAARELAVTFHALRWRSVSEARAYGVRFLADGEGWRWVVVRDGNANGLRRAEIDAGVDPIVSGPHRLRGRRARFGFPDVDRVPRIPPQGGSLPLDDPLRLGASDLVSFTPIGRSSTGSIYLTDGARELYGVVLFGPGTRVRVWRYDVAAARWRL